ncbi:hypothetical protein BO78DRAFT_193263 [Aspergillus sclerotiicarbonarius CBS 121057]|uniref:Uncharacterized protein n=1 Tax=Aspergillus sclerotiicarbonarius (strain CBS 121057 / IBT 28362) TaxID=1448318 RepID=A0A319E647_ASPSB|nr:hypothetical protein BO78DRAFT_193263 [Aspergillus sclerotiicarbonarius CBS 121057]
MRVNLGSVTSAVGSIAEASLTTYCACSPLFMQIHPVFSLCFRTCRFQSVDLRSPGVSLGHDSQTSPAAVMMQSWSLGPMRLTCQESVGWGGRLKILKPEAILRHLSLVAFHI